MNIDTDCYMCSQWKHADLADTEFKWIKVAQSIFAVRIYLIFTDDNNCMPRAKERLIMLQQDLVFLSHVARVRASMSAEENIGVLR